MPSENVHNHITNKNNDEAESFRGAHSQDLTDADYHKIYASCYFYMLFKDNGKEQGC